MMMGQLSKQLQMRLQYAKLKVEHGWVGDARLCSNPSFSLLSSWSFLITAASNDKI